MTKLSVLYASVCAAAALAAGCASTPPMTPQEVAQQEITNATDRVNQSAEYAVEKIQNLGELANKIHRMSTISRDPARRALIMAQMHAHCPALRIQILTTRSIVSGHFTQKVIPESTNIYLANAEKAGRPYNIQAPFVYAESRVADEIQRWESHIRRAMEICKISPSQASFLPA